MALAALNSSTGQTILPDVGNLTYAGIKFSSLYKSTIEAAQILDEANRTVKWVQYTLNVEGVVTLPPPGGVVNNLLTTDALWRALRVQLSLQGQQLIYQGNGFGGLALSDQLQDLPLAFRQLFQRTL